MKYFIIISIAVFSMLISGCNSTSVSASWLAPEHHARHFDKLLVVGMSSSIAARVTVEDEVVYFLRLQKISAISGSDILPSNRKAIPKDKEVIRKNLMDNGFDGVLAISLLDNAQSTRYVSGSATYSPVSMYGGYYGSFYSYYPHMYSNVYQPGYYANSQTVIIQTNLFDVETGDLLWSSQSKTTDPASLDEFANSYARGIVNYLLKRKILLPNSEK